VETKYEVPPFPWYRQLEDFDGANWKLWLLVGTITVVLILGICWAGWYAWKYIKEEDRPQT
jgi:hypothetical protein